MTTPCGICGGGGPWRKLCANWCNDVKTRDVKTRMDELPIKVSGYFRHGTLERASECKCPACNKVYIQWRTKVMT